MWQGVKSQSYGIRAVFQGYIKKQEKDTGLQSFPRVGSRQTATPADMRVFALFSLKNP